MQYVLGVDLATSGAKCVVLDAEAKVRRVTFAPYPLDTTHPGQAEQDPAFWWEATVRCIKEAVQTSGLHPADAQGIGLTGQMHGLVLLDAAFNVIRPAIIWLDNRSAPQCAEIAAKVGAEEILRITGAAPLPGFTAPKLMWVKEHDPQSYSRIRHLLLPKDYIRYRLTGALGTDVSDASGTMLFDVSKRRWSNILPAALGIPPEWLPPVYESGQIAGRLSQEAAAEVGLPAGLPVLAGAGDQAAAALTCGAFDEGVVAMNIGSGGVVFAATRHPLTGINPGLHAFCHSIRGRWHLMGVVQTAGLALRWWRDAFCSEEMKAAELCGLDAYDVVVRQAGQVPLDKENPIFLPYLAGERSPHQDPNAGGVFFGLKMQHTKAYLARSMLEGVAFGMRDCVEAMRAAGAAITTLHTGAGGGYQNPVWRQIQADILGLDLHTFAVKESSASGAAMLAADTVGMLPNMEEAFLKLAGSALVTHCHPEAHQVYERKYQLYREIYQNLKETFRKANDS